MRQMSGHIFAVPGFLGRPPTAAILTGCLSCAIGACSAALVAHVQAATAAKFADACVCLTAASPNYVCGVYAPGSRWRIKSAPCLGVLMDEIVGVPMQEIASIGRVRTGRVASTAPAA